MHLSWTYVPHGEITTVGVPTIPCEIATSKNIPEKREIDLSWEGKETIKKSSVWTLK